MRRTDTLVQQGGPKLARFLYALTLPAYENNCANFGSTLYIFYFVLFYYWPAYT